MRRFSCQGALVRGNEDSCQAGALWGSAGLRLMALERGCSRDSAAAVRLGCAGGEGSERLGCGSSVGSSRVVLAVTLRVGSCVVLRLMLPAA